MTIPIPRLSHDPATRLSAVLAGMGLNTPVVAEGALALLRPPSVEASRALAGALTDPTIRAGVLRAARALGFTHAALEIPELPTTPDTPSPDEDAVRPETDPAAGARIPRERPYRLFVGVMLPPVVGAAIEERIIAPLRLVVPDAAWVSSDRLHLTLKFLGDQPASLVEPLAARLTGVAAAERAFQLTLTGVGAFPGLQRPRVIWLGGRDAGECTRLAHRVDDACAAFNIVPDDRAFRPHVTMARLRAGRTTPPIVGLREAAAPLWQEWSFVVREIALVRSTLTPEGSRYTILARAPLATAI